MRYITKPLCGSGFVFKALTLFFCCFGIFQQTAHATAVSIVPTSGSNAIFYVDTAGNVQPNLIGNYVIYNITNNTGATIDDAWVQIANFTGNYVSLAPNENGIAHLGTMANGATQTAFFYLGVNCSTFSAGNCNISTPQGFTISVYSGPPTTTLLGSFTDSVTVQETTAASANKVTNITTSAANPSLGSLITVTVVGNTGTIASDRTFYISPETYSSFPATSFRLVGTSITFNTAPNTGTYTNQLVIPTSAFPSTAATDYTAVYTYRVVGPTTTTTTASPVAFISSGGQMKHTNTGSYSTLPPIGITSNSLTLQNLASSAVLPNGGTVTYTARVTNVGASSATVDDFVDTLSSTPAAATYVPGSSTFAGNPIDDPIVSGSTLEWAKTFTIPANSTADLTFEVTIPNTPGTYTNSIVGYVGTTPIDTTLDTADSSPATVNVSVGTPDLTITKTHSGNFTQRQTGATYTIVVSNGGNGPTNGTVTVADSLPAGMTATAMGGTGWNCTAATATCTRTDALSNGSSYPAITLTVTVASNAASSLVNTVSVSGGGESNTSNDSANDLTTIDPGPPLTATTTSLGASSTTPAFGTNVTLTATVSPAPTGSPLGTVNFYDGATLLGSAPVNSAGIATLATSSLTVGSHTTTAAYSGNTDFDTSTSSTVMIAVSAASSSTALAASNSTPTFGSSVTLTATVSPMPTGSSLGTVNFYNGATLLGTGAVNTSGLAMLSTSSLPVGADSITAVYSGNSTLAASTSAVTIVTVSTVATTTAVSTSNATPSYGSSVTLTASVSPIPTGSSLGTVAFYNGATLLGSGTLSSSGIASLSTSSLRAGTNSITAVYSGNTTYATSTSSAITITVTETTTATVLAASTLTPVAGSSVVFTATVTPTPTGSSLGTVNFYDGSTLLGTGPVNSSGVATFTTSTLPVGTNSVTAAYSGNATLAASTSSAVSVTVTQGSMSLSASVTAASGSSPVYGSPLTIATTLQGGGSSTASGTVSYVLNGKPLSSQNINNGVVPSFTASGLPAGTYALVITYGGDSTHASSTITIPFTVLQAPLTLTSADASRAYGTANPAFTGTISGVVNGDSLTETFSTTATIGSPAGIYSITPGISGTNASNYKVTAQAGKLTITQTSLTITLAPLTNAFVGSDSTLTATVVSSTSGTPTGTVSFYDGSTLLGTGTVDTTGIAIYTTNTLSQGTHTFSAIYAGDNNFTATSSASITAVVNPAYTVTAPPAPVPLAPNGSANVNVSIPPVGGAYNSVVVLSAAGLPDGITATFDPPTVIPGSAGAQTVMTLHYKQTASLAPQEKQHNPFAPAGVFAAGLCLLFVKRKQLPKALMAAVIFLSLLAGVTALSGCGGGWGNFANATPKSIVVTVIGTSGTIQHSTTVTVNLK